MLSSLTLRRILLLAALFAFALAVLPPATVAAPPKDGSFVYYVQYGDTLFSLARRYGTTPTAIMTANNLSGSSIYVGQRLVIPVAISPAPGFDCQYMVQPLDTLFSIAFRYQTSVESLMRANYLYSPLIYIGRPLNVPCLNPTPTPFPTYTVQPGDNIFRIAIRYNTTIYAIALVNRIPNPSLIFPGETLVVPYPGSFIWPPIPTPVPTSIPPTPAPTETATVTSAATNTGTVTLTPATTFTGSPTSTGTVGATGSATPTRTTTATSTSTSTPTLTPTIFNTVTPSSGSTVCAGTCYVLIMPLELKFNPPTLTITRGSSVTWVNADSTTHTIIAGTPGTPSGVFQSPALAPGTAYNFTFNNTGDYPYYDQVQGANMTGKIVVQ